jgi:hypothetical protein
VWPNKEQPPYPGQRTGGGGGDEVNCLYSSLPQHRTASNTGAARPEPRQVQEGVSDGC